MFIVVVARRTVWLGPGGRGLIVGPRFPLSSSLFPSLSLTRSLTHTHSHTHTRARAHTHAHTFPLLLHPPAVCAHEVQELGRRAPRCWLAQAVAQVPGVHAAVHRCHAACPHARSSKLPCENFVITSQRAFVCVCLHGLRGSLGQCTLTFLPLWG